MKKPNTLTTWSPLGDLDRIGRGLLGFFGNTPSTFGWGTPIGSCDWMPEVDVAEDENEYMLIADLPEVKKENLHVSLENGAISIYGERKARDNEDRLTYHRSERAIGRFGRSFVLPDNADTSSTRAEFREGSLSIHIPKAQPTAANRKEISIAS